MKERKKGIQQESKIKNKNKDSKTKFRCFERGLNISTLKL